MVARRAVGQVGSLLVLVLVVMHRTRAATDGHTLERKRRILRVRGGGGLLVVQHARVAARSMDGRRDGGNGGMVVVVAKRLLLLLHLLLQQNLLLKVLVRQGRLQRRLRLGERCRHHVHRAGR